MGMGKVELSREGFLGYTVDGERVYVRIELRRDQGRTGETIEHEQISDPLELAISGHTYDKGSKRFDYDSAGQIVDTLTRMNPRKLAEGWTAEDVAALHALWKGWHLNATRAGCAHQEPVYEDSKYGRRVSMELTPLCPQTGYPYGRSWLIVPLPDEVAEQARRFAGMLDGTNGLRERTR